MVESRRLETDARIAKLRGDIGRPLEDIATARARPRPGQPRAATSRRWTHGSRRGPRRTRLHIKVHKSAELARLQLDAGGAGRHDGDLAEAVAMADPERPTFCVEPGGLPGRGRATRRGGTDRADPGSSSTTPRCSRRPGVLLWGRGETFPWSMSAPLDRGGARSIEETLRLAELAAETDGVSFDGLMGYEGHCASEPDRSRPGGGRAGDEPPCPRPLRPAEARASRSSRLGGRDRAFEITGAAAGVTEVQAGCTC